ncbi:S10 family peptidase [Geotalea uraniireducens]|nr:peptidase S10 [Geotalea uraniireducens]
MIILIPSILLAAALITGTPYHASHPVPEAAVASDAAKGEEKQPEKDKNAAVPEKPVVTRHKVVVENREIGYMVTTGHLPVMNDAGESEAQIFFIAYTADNPSPGIRRPLLFIFNGGPGAASVWLHLGAVGPRRVQMLPDGRMPPPPYQLVDNEFTWLDQADLVFIDPVGTGYSRAVKPELTKKFATVQGDIDSVGRFIRLYLARYGRWNSPLFLVGESYGAFRAAGLSDYLFEHGAALNGIILISSVMNMQAISFDQGNDLPYELFLPSYTATAWYHKKLSPDLQGDLDKTLATVENWAATGYLTALGKGDTLSPEERRTVVEKLSAFTGLDKSYIDNRNLRIDNRSFVRDLLRDQRQVVGFMDSRFTAANLDPAAPFGFDPTVATIRAPYTATFNDYVRRELGFKSDLEYFTLGGGIGRWDWEAKNGYADSSENLRNAFAKNPYMKLFVASGCFDLATPHFSTEYTINHLGLTPALRGNITTRRYRAGHMMYLDRTSLSQLKKDVAAFIAGALVER